MAPKDQCGQSQMVQWQCWWMRENAFDEFFHIDKNDTFQEQNWEFVNDVKLYSKQIYLDDLVSCAKEIQEKHYYWTNRVSEKQCKENTENVTFVCVKRNNEHPSKKSLFQVIMRLFIQPLQINRPWALNA